jgi:sorbose reductase
MSAPSLFDLTGQKALVTGGSAGIGRACALALARAGADVAIADLNENAGQKTVNAIRDVGRDAIFVPCDVSRAEQVQSMVKATVQRFGRLDIAVNNAGIYRHGDDGSQPKEAWDQVIGVNLTGTWLCACAEMQQMTKQTPVGGKIINTASIGATIVCSNGAYDASKAAVLHLTRVLAARWGRYNINVNCISPGYVAAAMNGIIRPADERQRIRELTPLVFLASKASDYVTGQNLIVDGGHTLSPWLQPLERSVPPKIDPDAELQWT